MPFRGHPRLPPNRAWFATSRPMEVQRNLGARAARDGGCRASTANFSCCDVRRREGGKGPLRKPYFATRRRASERSERALLAAPPERNSLTKGTLAAFPRAEMPKL